MAQEKHEKQSRAKIPELESRLKPVGNANTYGTCYMSATLQLLEAAHAAKPEVFKMLLNASYTGLLAAYKATRLNPYQGSEAYLIGTIDVQPLVEEWVRQNPRRDYGTWVRKNYQKADGSVVTTELYPQRANKAYGGRPEEICARFVTEMVQAGHHMSLCDVITTIRLGSNGKTSASLFKCSWLLKWIRKHSLVVIQNDYHEQFVPPVTVAIDGSEGYRLTAVIQVVPHIYEEGPLSYAFHTGLHTICYTRYQDNWFKCNDHVIEPIAETAMLAELDIDARTTYEGRAQECGHWLGSPYPLLLLYSHTEKCN